MKNVLLFTLAGINIDDVKLNLRIYMKYYCVPYKINGIKKKTCYSFSMPYHYSRFTNSRFNDIIKPMYGSNAFKMFAYKNIMSFIYLLK